MWNRREIKRTAKGVFRANYWKCFLIAVLIGLFGHIGYILFEGEFLPDSSGRLSMLLMGLVLLGGAILLNPMEIGAQRFFYKNLKGKAELGELSYGFDRAYKNVVKIMFFRDLYVGLWTLLFIVPGIVKMYEYRMIPLLLAEYPDMPMQEAFALSKSMMMGNKFRTFLLDLSFLPWKLLNLCTLGIVGVFWTSPYTHQTDAALYDALKVQKHPFN